VKVALNGNIFKLFAEEYGIRELPAEWLVPSEEVASSASGVIDSSSALADLKAVADSCTACGLAETRKNVVFADGGSSARICFVGEAPGADEDRTGIPFVGKAGQLLEKAITAGMGLQRSEVYICNVLKCRPPGNRNPAPEEVSSCIKFLEQQIALVKPEVIVTLGAPALKALAGPERGGPSGGITKIRGQWLEYSGVPLLPTFHPAYLLRNPDAKKEFWVDLQEVMSKLGLQRPA